MSDSVELSVDEVVELAAINSEFYKHHFFPKAFRQASPACHRDIWAVLENPAARYVDIMLPRDWAKTTNLRAFASKRIAYAVSRTIVIVGISEDAAIKTLSWLKNAVEFNYKWANTYGLRKGKKWAEAYIEIIHDTMTEVAKAKGEPPVVITVMAIGITGSTRGINIDDFRPDLILVDDPCDEENTRTPEQREKMESLFFGSLYNSLAPETDSPEAKMVLLQTPLDVQDLINQCQNDPFWTSVSISCFTEDGKNSTWEDRHPYETLVKEKEAAISKNRLHIWMREKEVTVISSETSTFVAGHLEYWDMIPEGGINILAIDPTPPPRNTNEVSSGKAKKLDDAVILVIKLWKRRVYVVETYERKSPNPEEFIIKILELAAKHKVFFIAVETLLFARVLKFYLEKAMLEARMFFRIEPVEDKRHKRVRIEQEVSAFSSHGRLYVHQSQHKLISQFANYPNVAYDDYLDALAIGLSKCTPQMLALSDHVTLEGEYERIYEEDDHLLEDWRSAP